MGKGIGGLWKGGGGLACVAGQVHETHLGWRCLLLSSDYWQYLSETHAHYTVRLAGQSASSFPGSL